MLNKLRSNKGFTLIELLIVVAIIGILAAIAIPQFSAYRIKAFNSAATADIKNTKTAEESLFADNQTYGASEEKVILTAVLGTGGSGELLTGPEGPATTVAGAAIAGQNSAGNAIGVGVGVSNNVVLVANDIAAGTVPNSTSAAYVLVAKHTAGNRVYAAESASTALLFVQSDAFAGVPMTAATGAPAKGIPSPVLTTPSMAGTSGGGVAPFDKWQAM